jgi:large subunit ribosomal protein L35
MKLRTHKTTSKRFSLTGSGKIKQTKVSAQHLRHNKSRRQLAYAKGSKITSLANAGRIRKLLPNL